MAKYSDTPFAYHQEIEFDIDALTNLGVGLGRIDKWVVMVPYALPGERIRARVWRNHANHSQADLIAILRASPHRVDAHCSLFGTCGGCQYQHLSYEQQLGWKQQHVKDVLSRLAEVQCEVNDTHPSPVQWNYRTKLTPHFPRPRKDSFLPIGFMRTGSRRLVDVPQCPIATEAINRTLHDLRERVRHQAGGQRRRGGTLLLRDTNGVVCTDPRAAVIEKVGSMQFHFQAGSFFQNNAHILPAFLDYVIAQARADKVTHLLDLYCGVGVFSIWGHASFQRCMGIEVAEEAIAFALHNAILNSANSCDFIQGDAKDIFAQVSFDASHTCTILDPPRTGCDTDFLDQLLNYKPARIVYVSCDPATQARDLKPLLAAGYRLEEVQPFDLFPQTRHIENVITLSYASHAAG